MKDKTGTLKGTLGYIVALGLIGSAGCGGDTRQASSDDLDSYRQEDVEFLASFQPGQTVPQVEYYETLEAAAQSASAVVVGEVVDAESGPSGGPPDDVHHTVTLIVRPVELVVGELPNDVTEDIPVVFPGGRENPEEHLDELKERLPKGQFVWFLRSGTQLAEATESYLGERDDDVDDELLDHLTEVRGTYMTINSSGLFAQGQDGVVNPSSNEGEGDANEMAGEGESYPKLSALTEYLRTVEGWHGRSDEIDSLLEGPKE